eukprot:3582862-Amphidinium_carterae.1
MLQIISSGNVLTILLNSIPRLISVGSEARWRCAKQLVPILTNQSWVGHHGVRPSYLRPPRLSREQDHTQTDLPDSPAKSTQAATA